MQTIHLQVHGQQKAIEVQNLKPGMVTVWNGGWKAEIAGIKSSKSGKTHQIIYADGTKEYIYSDESWECALSKITFSDIYDGESYDSTYEEKFTQVKVQDYKEFKVVKQQGEDVLEQEIIFPRSIFKTPKGETVIDFVPTLWKADMI